MEENLKEMLGKRPDELEGETLKLFNAIMKIADERDELKLKCKELKEIEENHRKENGELREKVKQLEGELEKINKQLDLDYVDNNYIPVSLVKEKIEELKSKSGGNVFHIQQTINAEIRLLEELLEKRK